MLPCIIIVIRSSRTPMTWYIASLNMPGGRESINSFTSVFDVLCKLGHHARLIASLCKSLPVPTRQPHLRQNALKISFMFALFILVFFAHLLTRLILQFRVRPPTRILKCEIAKTVCHGMVDARQRLVWPLACFATYHLSSFCSA